MLYKELDNDSDMRKFGVYGILFITLAVLLGIHTYRSVINHTSVLGLADTLIAQTKEETTTLEPQKTGTTGTTETQKTGTIETTGTEETTGTSDPVTIQNEPVKTITTPIPIEPTATPVPIKTTTETVTEPVQNEINISDPNAEIIIKNEDNKLVITTEEDEELINIPAEPINDGTPDPTPVPINTVEPSQPPKVGTDPVIVITDPTPVPQQPAPSISIREPVIIDPTSTPAPVPGVTNPGTTDPIIVDQPEPEGITESIEYIVTGKSGGSILDIFSPKSRTTTVNTNSGTSNRTSQIETQPTTLFSRIRTVFSRRSSTPIAQSRTAPPTSAVKITYTSNTANIDLDMWLKDYQFQVWALGEEYIALHRDGITTITPYDIKLGLSKLSFKVLTELGEKQVLYYPDSVWSYLSTNHVISQDGHDDPLLLVLENDELVYQFEGQSHQLMFAFLPTSVCKKFVVSAQSRDIKVSKTCSPWDTAKDVVSITVSGNG